MNYKLRIKKNRNKGYTLIETMIAISIFTIIVMIGMGALLNANSLHNKSKDMLSIINSLSFTMDDMSRNLRTGNTYDCITTSTIPVSAVATSGLSCAGISFVSSNPVTQMAYFVGHNLSNSSTYSIFEETNGDSSTIVQITPDEVSIDQTNPFSIIGAEPPSGTSPDYQQPFVNIRLVGHIAYKNVTSPFSLQTSVSQRQIDL